jgi:hypothetical protein
LNITLARVIYYSITISGILILVGLLMYREVTLYGSQQNASQLLTLYGGDTLFVWIICATGLVLSILGL